MRKGYVVPAVLVPAGTSLGYLLAAGGRPVEGFISLLLAPAVAAASLVGEGLRQTWATVIVLAVGAAVLAGLASPFAVPAVLAAVLLLGSEKPGYAVYGLVAGLSLVILHGYSVLWGAGIFALATAALYIVVTGYAEAVAILMGLYTVCLILGYPEAVVVGSLVYTLYILALLSKRVAGSSFDRGLVVSGLILHVFTPFAAAPWMPSDLAWLLAAVSSYLVSTGLLSPRS